MLRLAEPVFYSLQMEGAWTGTPALFVRLAGCNRSCAFCDTDHTEREQRTPKWIAKLAAASGVRTVVITGGEPLLQMNAVIELTERLQFVGNRVHIETNGTIDIEPGLHGYSSPFDWLTVSPKDAEWGLLDPVYVSEIKLVYPNQLAFIPIAEKALADLPAGRLFLQPCWEEQGDAPYAQQVNLKETITYVKEHPKWRLSLQGHKILGIQ